VSIFQFKVAVKFEMLELFSDEGVEQFCAVDILSPKEQNIKKVKKNLDNLLIIVVILKFTCFIHTIKIVEPANLRN